ncbi:DUF1748-domain-containing protein [Lentinula edodes]|uniref:DUF1748-domain-containing protein n=1 Tax=Lentinula edodes TaxID=5353 RepID=A0A1Q3EEE4_LENED|nr:DUF1748-domain-containing protein [Lentinula edodes]
MALGRLFHYAFDAVLVSTVLAGVKKTSGFSLDIDQLTTNPTAKSAAESYLGLGESVYGIIQSTVEEKREKRTYSTPDTPLHNNISPVRLEEFLFEDFVFTPFSYHAML